MSITLGYGDTIPTFGILSASKVNSTLGRGDVNIMDMDADYSRDLAKRQGKGNKISFSDYRGKSASWRITITGEVQQNFNLVEWIKGRTLDNKPWTNEPIEIVVASKSYIIGTDHKQPTILIKDPVDGIVGSDGIKRTVWNKVTLINYGTIYGKGGKGGNGAICKHYSTLTSAQVGGVGGTALQCNRKVILQQRGSIVAGAGGGGGGGCFHHTWYTGGGGGGAPLGNGGDHSWEVKYSYDKNDKYLNGYPGTMTKGGWGSRYYKTPSGSRTRTYASGYTVYAFDGYGGHGGDIVGKTVGNGHEGGGYNTYHKHNPRAPGAAGGVAGKAIVGLKYITFEYGNSTDSVTGNVS